MDCVINIRGGRTEHGLHMKSLFQKWSRSFALLLRYCNRINAAFNDKRYPGSPHTSIGSLAKCDVWKRSRLTSKLVPLHS